ncbi:hypothetical protein TSOC_007342 [Tetrabaena socialis]|uniref:Uncharacterized protein n=1 Tax=Tetrabaena socialis TaxID=47790 RepID=A0A2J8A1F4_9CHLO|nr:hypothetical protein TSOC_007342 [Tetrabaena socialis]|eukprot:PNH06340.1 hypothetical protein TSOC_007342 [Tetrabaena socialis]
MFLISILAKRTPKSHAPPVGDGASLPRHRAPALSTAPSESPVDKVYYNLAARASVPTGTSQPSLPIMEVEHEGDNSNARREQAIAGAQELGAQMSGPVMHAYMQFLELAQRLLGRSEGAEAKFDTLINLASALNGKFDMLAGILEKLVADKTAVDPLLKELEAIHAMVVDLKLQTALASGCNIEDILKSAKVGDVPVSSEAITAYMEGRRADNSGAGPSTPGTRRREEAGWQTKRARTDRQQPGTSTVKKCNKCNAICRDGYRAHNAVCPNNRASKRD